MRVWFLFSLGLCIVGCKPTVGSTTDKPKSTKQPAAKSDAGENPASKHGIRIGPDMAKQLSTDQQKNIKRMIAAQNQAAHIRAEDAPEYAKKMVEHTRNIMDLMKTNLTDCAQMVDALDKYVTDNKEQLVSLRKQGEVEQAKIKPEEKSKRTMQTLLLLGPLAEQLIRTQSMVVRRCPEQAKRIAQILAAAKP